MCYLVAFHVRGPREQSLGADLGEELDTICELVDKLNEFGYFHRIAISDETRSRARSSNNSTSEEIREFFERE